jgi:hypothetical protein
VPELQWLDYLSRASVAVLLLVILWGGVKGWWVFGAQHRDQLAREQQAAAEMVTKERTTNAEVTRLWQERVNREVAAAAEADERCVAQAAVYERKLADAAERMDRLIGLGHAAVQTTRRVAGK